ncbi:MULTISPECIES: DUF2059 domain-containing protein [unclassified Acinetobacter]|uniref:DUF2059 domain-containing protein n=1 Tax=unclassified Acinetobacter TaxID=196816 RepID=UPI0025771876|nr:MULTISPECIES: DUF2059 domain-containing protein [unclassified Acinetobacter]MDM1763912.1 DUF2059 domain-containing protein [Acinetobacter sp. 226-1]MDM1767646.1 DUF2059 domain-containing protein [Acinetobacter sp. 226-4]
MKKFKTLLLSGLILITPYTFATPASDQQVQKLIEVMKINQLLQQTIQQIRPQLDQQAYTIVQNIVQHEKLNPQEQIVANELADQLHEQNKKSISWDKMQPIYQKIYKDIYTAEEVQAQIDFYSSQVGQSILAKSPVVAQESMKIVNTQLMSTIQAAEKDFAQVNKKLDALKKAAENK